MSSNNQQDPLAAAKQAERDLNSYQAKQGLNNNSDSSTSPSPSHKDQTNPFPALESGVNSYSPPPLPSALHSPTTNNQQSSHLPLPRGNRNLRVCGLGSRR